MVLCVECHLYVSRCALSPGRVFGRLLGCLLVFRKRVDRLVLLVSATVLTVGIPFLLPNMHDRYFYLADLLTLLLLFSCFPAVPGEAPSWWRAPR